VNNSPRNDDLSPDHTVPSASNTPASAPHAATPGEATPIALAPGAAAPTWSSDQLLGQANEAHIVHGGEVYRLLRTRNQKLILVK
jgi:hemin uptake protein HemP